MDVRKHNQIAWDKRVDRNDTWTVPVTHDEIAAARNGIWQILLTPTIPVPRSWFPELVGAEVLCLASGGGQQGPILAAAGASVTVFDNSPRQLDQDLMVAKREDLEIKTVEGDMRDLSIFPDAKFSLIFHPVANIFIPDIQPVWLEAYRVLKPGGILLAGITNPLRYLFDDALADRTSELKVIHKLPYSDVESLSTDQQLHYQKEGIAFEFSHTLEAQIGGQLEVGFLITGFYEDRFGEEFQDPLSIYTPSFMATRAVKGSVSLLATPIG